MFNQDRPIKVDLFDFGELFRSIFQFGFQVLVFGWIIFGGLLYWTTGLSQDAFGVITVEVLTSPARVARHIVNTGFGYNIPLSVIEGQPVEGANQTRMAIERNRMLADPRGYTKPKDD